MKLGRRTTTPLWMEKEAELRALQATVPPFFSLFLRKKRDEHQVLQARTEEEVKRLRHRMEMFDRCEPQVAAMIEQEIEVLLREDCPEYIQALAALGQKADWLSCLDRFSGRIFEFTPTLGNVRNIACSGYARQANVYSAAALQAFGLAIAAAQAVEEEVKLANRIADTQVEIFRANGIETQPLPRLPETSFSGWVDKIKAMPLAEAQPQFDALIDKTKQLHGTEVAELRVLADQVEAAQQGDLRNFLMAAWDQFRAEVAPEIFPGDTERSVSETEKMLTAAAQPNGKPRRQGRPGGRA